MKLQSKRKQNLSVFIAGVLPVVLAVVVFALFFLIVDMKNQSDDQQRAADGAGNAAINLQWMLENGLEKLEVLEKRYEDGGADIEKLLSELKYDSGFSNVAFVRGGKIYYANGRNIEDIEIEKYPNCEIAGRLVRISGSEDGIRLHMSVDSRTDVICMFDSSDIIQAIGGVFKGAQYYAVYNIRTGDYVYSNLPFEGVNYYEALMGINESGDGEALFGAYTAQAYFRHLFGSEDGIVAQCRTNISPWGVAIVLPEGSFAKESGSTDHLFIIVGIAIVLQLTLSALFLAYVFRKSRKITLVNRDIRDITQKKLELSVEYTGVCVFEYDRSLGEIIDFHNGMADTNTEATLRPKSINEFVAYYRPNDDDALRLYEIFAEIKPGEMMNVDIRAFANERERLLRFRLQCLENGKTIVGSVRDCTQDEFSQIRIKDEEKFLELMKPKSASIWEIRVDSNQTRVCFDKRGNTQKRFGVEKGVWMRYEDEFPEKFREHLHPADADQFAGAMSLSSIMDAYRSGKTEIVHDCRVRSVRKEGYEWHRQMLRMYEDPGSKEIMARLYMLNVDAEKNAEMERRERLRIHQQTLTAIGGIYYGLYYIELDNNLCYTAKSHAGELGSDICVPLKTAFSGYIEQYVHEEDREGLRRLTDPYMLRKQVTEERHFHRCEFRRRVGERYEWAVAIIQAARFENAQIRDVVLAFEDISEVKKV